MKLTTSIEQYIRRQQALGKKITSPARILRAFGRRFDSSHRLDAVTPDAVASFLGETGTTRYWYAKYRVLDRFYRQLLIRGDVQENPLPSVTPQRMPGLTPYIYSCDEIHRLLVATDEYQILPSKIEPITIRILILLLYGTGIRIGEARHLKHNDVSFDESLITIRETKFYKSRLVPMNPKLTAVLKQYARRKTAQSFVADPSGPLLTTRTGTGLKQATVNGIFRRVCSHAGIHRPDGGRYQPRLHDLRHNADFRIMPTGVLCARLSCIALL